VSLALFAAACRPAALQSVDQAIHVRRGGDVIAAGRAAAVNDSVPGDVMAAAADIHFSGDAGGDLLGGAGNLELAGRVGGSLRAAGGNVRMATDVLRNVTVAGGNVVLERSGHVHGNAYFAGGTIRLEGAVDQLVRAAGTEVILNGPVGGDVHVESERLRVGPDAVIDGDLRYRLKKGNTANIDPGARITGQVIALPPVTTGIGDRLLHILRLLGFLVAGTVFVAMLPRATAVAETRLRARPGASFGLGLAWLILVPIAVLVLAITVIGLPLALLNIALYLVFVYLARAVVAVWLGRLMLQRRVAADRTGLTLSFLAGGGVLLLLGLIPWIGALITVVACLFGLGAIALALSGATQEPGTAHRPEHPTVGPMEV